MNIFDILILGFIILGALQGYRKGLISGFLSLAGSILGLIFAAKEYMRVLAWLDQYTPIRQWLEPVIYKIMLPSVEAQAQITQQQALERILSMIPQELRNLVGSGTVPDFQAYTQSAIQGIAQTMSGVLTDNLLKVIAFALTYFLINIIIEVISSLILSPLRLFSGTVNRGGGFILGGLGALVGLSVFLGLLAPFITLTGQDTPWALLQEAQSYPFLVQIFNYLVEIFRINFDQGLTMPMDFTEITLPELKLN